MEQKSKSCVTCKHAKMNFSDAFCTLLPIWVYISESPVRSIGYDNLVMEPGSHYCGHHEIRTEEDK